MNQFLLQPYANVVYVCLSQVRDHQNG